MHLSASPRRRASRAGLVSVAIAITALLVASCSSSKHTSNSASPTKPALPSNATLATQLLTVADLGVGWGSTATKSAVPLEGCLGGLADGTLAGSTAFADGGWKTTTDFPGVLELLVQFSPSSVGAAFAKERAVLSTCSVPATVDGKAMQLKTTSISLAAVGDEAAGFEAQATGSQATYTATLDLFRRGDTLALLVYVTDGPAPTLEVDRIASAAAERIQGGEATTGTTSSTSAPGVAPTSPTAQGAVCSDGMSCATALYAAWKNNDPTAALKVATPAAVVKLFSRHYAKLPTGSGSNPYATTAEPYEGPTCTPSDGQTLCVWHGQDQELWMYASQTGPTFQVARVRLFEGAPPHEINA